MLRRLERRPARAQERPKKQISEEFLTRALVSKDQVSNVVSRRGFLDTLEDTLGFSPKALDPYGNSCLLCFEILLGARSLLCCRTLNV